MMGTLFIVALIAIGLLLAVICEQDIARHQLREQLRQSWADRQAAIERAQIAERSVTIARQRAQDIDEAIEKATDDIKGLEP